MKISNKRIALYCIVCDVNFVTVIFFRNKKNL